MTRLRVNGFSGVSKNGSRSPSFASPSVRHEEMGIALGPDGLLTDPAKDAKSLDPPPRFEFGDPPRILKDFEDWNSLKVIPPEVSNADLPITWDPSNVVVVFSVREAPKKQWGRIWKKLRDMHDALPLEILAGEEFT